MGPILSPPPPSLLRFPARWLINVEDGYTGRLYHSNVHAADVLQSLHTLVTRGRVASQSQLNELSVLSMYMAAIIHDYEHLGVNNDYLVSTQVLGLGTGPPTHPKPCPPKPLTLSTQAQWRVVVIDPPFNLDYLVPVLL